MLFGAGAAILAIVLVGACDQPVPQPPALGTAGAAATPVAVGCQSLPYRQDEAANLIAAGAILTYERNGGPTCLDELYAIYPDGRIVGDDGTNKIERRMHRPAGCGRIAHGHRR